VIKYTGSGPEPDKDVFNKSLADAGKFVRDYFGKKI
jgi:hypothetical protein